MGISPHRVRFFFVSHLLRKINRHDGRAVASVLDAQGNGFFEYEFDQGKKEGYARMRSSAGMVRESWFERDWETKRAELGDAHRREPIAGGVAGKPSRGG
ncbi:MAG TPA: hypothetical protein VMU60_02695 [Syntrophobacteria bacterium]|nr:hypothetical protein [Syntrophobacteria bacterium]